MYYWIAYKTGTTTNPVIISTPASGSEFTSLSQGNPTVVNGTSYTVTTGGGPYGTQAAAQAGLSRITAADGKPPASAAQTSGWIAVPEGTAGEIVNALATEGDAVKGITGAGSLSGIGSELSNLAKITADATGSGPTTYTVEHLTTAGQVVAAQNAGLTVYSTQAQAQAAANQQNTDGNGSWEQSLANFLNALDSKNTWIRAAKVLVGSIMIIVGLANLTGAGRAAGKVAGTAAGLAL